MSDANLTLQTRGQLAAIAWLRWRLFVNALRSTRGQLELISHIFVSIAFAIGGLGGAFGMGVATYFFMTTGKPEMIALLLWSVFIFWQVFPVMATAFTNNPDSTDLLRFPLSYRSYFLVRLAYGAFDPATALGSMWSFGILVGVGFARPAAALDAAGVAGLCRLQSAVHANGIRLGRALAGAAPHARNHGHSVSSADAELSVDRAADALLRQQSGPVRSNMCTATSNSWFRCRACFHLGLPPTPSHRRSFRDSWRASVLWCFCARLCWSLAIACTCACWPSIAARI